MARAFVALFEADGEIRKASSRYRLLIVDDNGQISVKMPDQTEMVLNAGGPPPITVNSGTSARSGVDESVAVSAHTQARRIASLTATPTTTGPGETVLWSVPMPVGAVPAGTVYRLTLRGLSSSTGTLIFRLRVGTTGTVADALLWASMPTAAQVANQHAGVTILATAQSPTTIKAEGDGSAGAAAIQTLTGAAVTAAFTPTAAWRLTLTVQCSVGTFTAHAGLVEGL